MPMEVAISSSGASFALRATSRFFGIVMLANSWSNCVGSSRRFDALQHLTPPRLGLLHVVEGVDVEAREVALGVGQGGLQAEYQAVRAVSARHKHLEQPVALLQEEAR